MTREPEASVLARIEASIPALRRYAAALLRGRQDADDLVHDTLLRGLDRLASLRAGSDPRAWLFSIMHNLFISQTRRARIRPLPAGGGGETPDDAGPAIAPTQDDAVRIGELVCALDRLPPEQREVLLLISVEGLTYAEAAQVLAVPQGTVMSRLSRGRERLRQLTEAATVPCVRPTLRRVK